MTQADFSLRIRSVAETEIIIAPVLMRHDGQLLVLTRSDEDEDGSDLRLRTPVPLEDFMEQHKARIVSFFPTPVNKRLRTVVFQVESQDVNLKIEMSDTPQPWMVAAAEEITSKLGVSMPPEQVHDLWKGVLRGERERAERLGDPFGVPVSDDDSDADLEDEVTVQEFLEDLMGGTAEDFALGVRSNGRHVHVGRMSPKEVNMRDLLAFMRTGGMRDT